MNAPILVLIVLLGTAVIAGLFFLLRKSALGQAQKAQAGLPGEWEARTLGGVAHQLKFRPRTSGKNSQPSLLSLRVATASKIDLQINRENWFDRFCKSLGIAREFQTGNRPFDDAWYLRGEIDTRLGMQLKQGELRGKIHGLMSAGFTELRHRPGWLQLDWTGFDPGKHTMPGEVEVAALAAVGSALPAASNAPIPRQTAAKAALWSVVIGYGACFLLGLAYPPVREWDLWRLVLPAAALSFAMFAWTAAFVLRGYSRSHDHWILLAVAGLLCCTIGSRGVLGWWNGHEDPSPVGVQQVQVLSHWTSRHKNRTTYRVKVPDWKRDGATLSYRVERQEYDQIARGARTFEVRTQAGRLRVEWQHGYRVLP
ncbi:MAG: hypothetical protein IPK27_05805 [Rhodanobacteraceae bacterium]|nr:hypothetical protein [Rhodanobacteraceae bacterium]